uniref:Fibronectin type III domain-containing protein n=1 Tax=Paracidobacterium acidisoli TaxID=2303751 RepID=A0A372IQJ1_9BACT
MASIAATAPILLAGCGLAAAPQPPSLKLPEPVTNLTAVRTGSSVVLHWTMPRRTTDRVTLVGGQRVHICRRVETAPCQSAGDILAMPGKPAEFTDTLPADLTTGSPRLLSYVLELRNHAGKTAGPSNSAFLAAGQAPSSVAGLRAEARVDGVVLHWQKAAVTGGTVLRIHRILITPPKAPKPSEVSGTPPPEEQTLEVDLTAGDPGIALDRGAALDHLWRYTAERVQKQTLETHAVETSGEPGGPVTLDAKDIFPPAVPQGLVAVADEQGKAIDLSWAPDTEPDLAGYAIYRRELSGTSPASPSRHPVAAPSFHDAAVQPGTRYAWSVSALDKDGNESPRSPEVEEELPSQPQP